MLKLDKYVGPKKKQAKRTLKLTLWPKMGDTNIRQRDMGFSVEIVKKHMKCYGY